MDKLAAHTTRVWTAPFGGSDLAHTRRLTRTLRVLALALRKIPKPKTRKRMPQAKRAGT
jgi:hypothetical protein